MEDSQRSASYRSLALLCEKQAALASTEATRRELLAMASEYRMLAQREEAPKK